MADLEKNNITLMERTETVEAEEIYQEKKSKMIWWLIVPCVLFAIFGALALVGGLTSSPIETWAWIMIAFAVVSFIAVTLCTVVYATAMAPYRELVKIAKHNDLVRHDERLRIKERERKEVIATKEVSKKEY